MVSKILNTIVLLLSIILSGSLIYYNILPLKYIIIVILFLISMFLLFTFFIKKEYKKIGILISLYIIILTITLSYIASIFSLFDNILDDNKFIDVYHVYAAKESKHNNLDTVDKLNYYIDDNVEKALKKVKKDIEFEESDNLTSLIALTKDDEVFLINENLLKIYEDTLDEELDLKIIKTIEIFNTRKSNLKTVNIKKDPFIIYVSGTDNYGSINNKHRSDVNMLLLVNPKLSKILIINTPRDSYVELKNKGFDKLTHAGVYGINESIYALNDLYNININFYVKINFTSFIKIIDEVGPIKANSNYNFTYDGYTFYKGENTFTGNKALAFSRGRKMLPEGDISRGENQQEIIKGLINSLKTPKVLSSYNNILKHVEGSLLTNMDSKTISTLINMQLKNNYNWEIETVNLKGTSALMPTYSLGNLNSSVVIVDKKDLGNIKLLIEKNG